VEGLEVRELLGMEMASLRSSDHGMRRKIGRYSWSSREGRL
jgi:hypothetical protein